MTALMLAAENGQKEIVEIILANDGIKGINYTNNDSYTALSLAASTGHSEIVRILTALPEISIASVTVFGMNAFMLAADSGSIPTLVILKEKGIDVDAINNFGLSALMLACQHEKGYLKVVQYLCEKAGARVSLTSNNNSVLPQSFRLLILCGVPPSHCCHRCLLSSLFVAIVVDRTDY